MAIFSRPGFYTKLRTQLDGITWSELIPSSVISVFAEENLLLAGGDGGQVYHSDDGGASWAVTTCQLMPLGVASFVSEVAAKDETLLFLHSFSDMYLSEDNGGTWRKVALDLANVQSDGEFLYASAGRELLRSNDGIDWEVITEAPIFISDLAVSGDQLAVASFDGVAVSGDGGQTWSTWNAGLEDPDGDADQVVIDDDGFVFVASGNAVQRSVESISGSGTASEKGDKLDRTLRLDAFPVPARDELRIEASIPGHDSVRIELYDMTGRRIRVLFEGSVPSSFLHRRDDLRGLPAGAYVVRLRAGANSIDQTIILQ